MNPQATKSPAPKSAPAPKVEVKVIPEGKGKGKNSEHHLAWVGCPDFAPTDTLKLVSEHVRWGANTHGARFYAATLAKKPATVAALLELAGKAGFPAKAAMRHLRWFYTWASDLEVNGKVHGATSPAKASPVKPSKAA